MTLLLVSALWAVLITFVAVAVKAGIQSGRLGALGATLAIAGTIAAFPLAIATSGAIELSSSTLLISVVALVVPTSLIGYLIFRRYLA